jgi:hypothetical protein
MKAACLVSVMGRQYPAMGLPYAGCGAEKPARLDIGAPESAASIGQWPDMKVAIPWSAARVLPQIADE